MNQQPSPEATTTQTQTQAPDQKLEGNKKKWVTPLLIITVIATFIGSTLWFLNSSKTQETSQETAPQQTSSFSDLIEHPDKTNIEKMISEFLSFNQNNNKQGAQTLLSSQTNQQSFASTFTDDKNIPSLYGKRFKFDILRTSASTLKDTAFTEVEIEVADFTLYHRYTSVKEGNSWKLTDFQILDFDELGETTTGTGNLDEL